MKTKYTAAFLFGGIGGGALGFSGARAEYMGKLAEFENICSIDADPVVCDNYEQITGGRAVRMDLFDRQQYIDFHGGEPPADWHEAESWDIWQAFGERVPDVIFTSPPCKGFSGLLPEKSAGTKKYQALNLLTVRGIDISLAACRDYGGELPALFLLENVPRIMTRGKKILDRIKATLTKYGYVVNDETHDCGEIGGLGQHRKRYLLIARNEKRMPAFIYKPEIKPLKTIGEVIGRLPLPGDEVNGGPMHRVPMLQRKTWERLAFIPAGGDWRDLEKVEYEKYRLEHVARAGAWAVDEWNEPGRTVTGGAGVGRSNGLSAVNDPRTGFKSGTHTSIYRVSRDDEPAPTVTGAMRPNNGSLCVGDPRLKDRDSRHGSVYRIVRYDEPAPCVTGTRFGSGAIAVADARVNTQLHPDSYGVQNWEKPSKAVRGANRIMQSLLPNTVLALQVELGELANEWRGFKHWSNDQAPRREKMLVEYVDCLHFFLSIARQLDLPADDLYAPGPDEELEGSTAYVFTEIMHFVGRISLDKGQTVIRQRLRLGLWIFYSLGEQRLGFTWEKIAAAYVDKNRVNHERQANGY